MTGRIVMSSWETLRASGTSIVCLSPVRIVSYATSVCAYGFASSSGAIPRHSSYHVYGSETSQSIPPLLQPYGLLLVLVSI